MNNNRSMPTAVIIPELPYPDVAEAARWLCQTFGFVQRLRIGNHRAQLSFGAGSIVVTKRPSRPASGASGCSVMVRVADVDEHYQKVKQSGATVLQSPADFPYGERQYLVKDPGGHHWTFSQTIADVDPASWGGILYE